MNLYLKEIVSETYKLYAVFDDVLCFYSTGDVAKNVKQLF